MAEYDQNGSVIDDSSADSGTHLDSDTPTGDITPQSPEAPTANPNELDWRALYAQSVRDRQEREAELAALRAQQNTPAPQPQDESITDEDIQKYGTVGTIERVVAKVLRKELQGSLGDVGEISRDFKRNKQLDSAEASFYSQYPHLSQYRETLSPTIRGQLQNAPNVDPMVYAQQAFATIGYYTAMNAANNPTPSRPVANNTPTPTPSVPNRVNGSPAAPKTNVRLSELERTGMRRMGLDPNKREDVDSFMDMVNNDGGITR